MTRNLGKNSIIPRRPPSSVGSASCAKQNVKPGYGMAASLGAHSRSTRPQGTPRTGLQTFPQQSRIGAPLLVANSQFHPLDHATRPKPAGASPWLGILGPMCTLCLLKAASSNTSTIHFFHHICSSIFLAVVWCLYKPLVLAPFLSEVFVYVSFLTPVQPPVLEKAKAASGS